MKIKSICGVIIASDSPRELANFYATIFNVQFEREEHGNVATHYGLDIGEVHLGIHPPSNLGIAESGNSSISIAYNVDSLDEVISKLTELGAEQVIPVRDEGFGDVVTYKDPEGNCFEIVELKYDFSDT